MSSDIDIGENMWVTVHARGVLELNIERDGDIMSVCLDPNEPEQRCQIESLKSAIQHCLNITSTHFKGEP